ncbi:MAG: hypothetical protein LBS94_04680, partial [Prevotellaceae bacterium]|nr:hypothetical protein [Prevotellaceae bacterium]
MANHSFFLTCYVAASLMLAGCAKPETLRIAGLEGLLDSALIAQFESEYLQKTGKIVDLKYLPYEEHQLVAEASQGKLYDMMLTTNTTTPFFKHLGVLASLDHSRIRPLDDYLPYMVDFPSDVGNEYTLPYSYLIMGIVYDATKISPKEASTIAVLWDKKWAGHIVMQSLELVLYGTTAIYIRRDKLEEMSNGYTTYTQDYRDSVQVWITKCDSVTRTAVKKALVEQFALVSKYATGAKLSVHIARDSEWVGWMRHPEAITALKFNHDLQFSYAREGSAYSPYLFSITTACKNSDLAYEFLRFISRTDVVVQNMRKNSIPGVISEAVELCHDEIVNDTVQLAGTTREWRENFFDLFNMPEDVAKRT